jgi:glycosyltransferase involved in cell wall biosynthesis
MGAEPSRVVVVPLVSHDQGRGLPDKRTTDAPLTFLYVGQLIPRKGVDILLAAFEQLEGAALWIVGDGPLEELVRSAAARCDRVRYLGYQDSAALSSIYDDVDVVVVPSRHEVWGLTVNEGLAHGKPVIATDAVGAGDDLIEKGVTGLIVPAADVAVLRDAMREVLTWSSDHRREAARAATRRMDEWSLDAAADAFVRAVRLAAQVRR